MVSEIWKTITTNKLSISLFINATGVFIQIKHLANLISGKIVNVEITDIDKYSRGIGVVWTLDSLNVNIGLVKSGLACHYKQFDKSEEYAEAEHLDKINKLEL